MHYITIRYNITIHRHTHTTNTSDTVPLNETVSWMEKGSVGKNIWVTIATVSINSFRYARFITTCTHISQTSHFVIEICRNTLEDWIMATAISTAGTLFPNFGSGIFNVTFICVVIKHNVSSDGKLHRTLNRLADHGLFSY